MKVITQQTPINATHSLLAKSVSALRNEPFTLFKIYLLLFLLDFIVCLIGNSLSVAVFMVCAFAVHVYFYFMWSANPDFTIWGNDFKKTFYQRRDNPTKKQGVYIHKFLALLFIIMGLQREAGLINPKYKSRGNNLLSLILRCSPLNLLIAQIHTMASFGMLQIAINSHEITGIGRLIFIANEFLTTFGVFMIISVAPFWLLHQVKWYDRYLTWSLAWGSQR